MPLVHSTFECCEVWNEPSSMANHTPANHLYTPAARLMHLCHTQVEAKGASSILRDLRIKLKKLEEKERKPPQNENSRKLYIAQCNPCGADPPQVRQNSAFQLKRHLFLPDDLQTDASFWFFSRFWPSNSDLRNISSADFGLVSLLCSLWPILCELGFLWKS